MKKCQKFERVRAWSKGASHPRQGKVGEARKLQLNAEGNLGKLPADEEAQLYVADAEQGSEGEERGPGGEMEGVTDWSCQTLTTVIQCARHIMERRKNMEKDLRWRVLDLTSHLSGESWRRCNR